MFLPIDGFRLNSIATIYGKTILSFATFKNLIVEM